MGTLPQTSNLLANVEGEHDLVCLSNSLYLLYGSDMRLLGATRLSRKSDESTSIVRQREQITLTAKVRGDTLAHMTEDTDVSGSVSPFERDDLGQWLTDPDKISQWDGLIVAKLDRLTRSLSHFDAIVDWCDRNGKTLISVSESLDLSTSTGRMFANLLAMFAQFERERMAERRKEAAAKMKENGWFAGGMVPYGFRVVKVGDHREIEVDPDKAKIVERIAAAIIAGKTCHAIALELSADGIPTAQGAPAWTRTVVRQLFTHDKSVLDAETLEKVRRELWGSARTFTRRGDAAMLLNVAYCVCGQPLYARRYVSPRKKTAGKLYEYYDCADRAQNSHRRCEHKSIPMKELEQAVENSILEAYSWVPIVAKTVKPGKSHKTEITVIEREYRNLDLDDPDHAAKSAALLAERARLKSLTSEPDEVDMMPTGQTTAEYWPTLDSQGKRAFLIKNGVKVHAQCNPDGGLPLVMLGPDPEAFEGNEFFIMVDALSTMATWTTL